MAVRALSTVFDKSEVKQNPKLDYAHVILIKKKITNHVQLQTKCSLSFLLKMRYY